MLLEDEPVVEIRTLPEAIALLDQWVEHSKSLEDEIRHQLRCREGLAQRVAVLQKKLDGVP